MAPPDMVRSFALIGAGDWWGGVTSNSGPSYPANLAFGRRVANPHPITCGWNGCPTGLINPSKLRSAETVIMVELGTWNPANGAPWWPWAGANNGLYAGPTGSVSDGPWGTISLMVWSLYSGPFHHEFKSSAYLFADGHVEEIAYPTPYNADWTRVAFFEGGDMTKQIFFVDKTAADANTPGRQD